MTTGQSQVLARSAPTRPHAASYTLMREEPQMRERDPGMGVSNRYVGAQLAWPVVGRRRVAVRGCPKRPCCCRSSQSEACSMLPRAAQGGGRLAHLSHARECLAAGIAQRVHENVSNTSVLVTCLMLLLSRYSARPSKSYARFSNATLADPSAPQPRQCRPDAKGRTIP